MTTTSNTAAVSTERTDAQKRSAVFLLRPTTVLVKVLAQGMIEGIFERPRDNTKIEIKHYQEASDRGLNAHAYRNRADTGHCVMEKEEGIRCGYFLTELRLAGYVLTDFFWQKQNEKAGPTHTFQFTHVSAMKEGMAEKQLPPAAERILTKMRFNHGTVWCNLRDKDGGGQFRLDTINLAKGRETFETSHQLHLTDNGKGYRVD